MFGGETLVEAYEAYTITYLEDDIVFACAFLDHYLVLSDRVVIVLEIEAC